MLFCVWTGGIPHLYIGIAVGGGVLLVFLQILAMVVQRRCVII